MNKVFCVFQSAVYRHSCFGVFTEIEEAIRVAKETALNDIDSHHNYDVVPYDLNSPLKFSIKDRYGIYADDDNPIFRTNKKIEES